METKKESAPGGEARNINECILGAMLNDATKLRKKSDFPNLEEEKKRQWEETEREFAEMCSPRVEEAAPDVLERGRVRLSDDIPPVDFLLYQGDVGTLPRRSLATIKGKPGQGKSIACSVFIASLMGCTDMGLKCPYSGLRIIYFDTEKNRVNTMQLGQRVNRMMGWSEESDNERLIMYNYKGEAVEERLQLIKDVTTALKPDVIVIDGIADVIDDYNDLTESKNIVEDLNRFSVDANVTIFVVLHTNKNDSNSQGHLGHFLLKKSHNEFELCQESGTFHITHTKSNDGHIKDIYFTLDDTLNPVGTEGAQTKKLRTLFERVFNGRQTMETDELVNYIMEVEKIKESMAKKRIAAGITAGIIKRTERGVYALIST